MTAAPPAAPDVTAIAHRLRRRQRAAAVIIDLGWLAGALAIGSVVAVTWLLLRTDRGRFDPGDGEAIVASALIAAAVPAWLAWLTLSARLDAATPGQRASRLRVCTVRERRPAGPLLRLCAHPVAAPAWLWVGALAWIADVPILAALLLAIAGTIVLMAGVSAALVIRDPAARAVHDYVGGTVLLVASTDDPITDREGGRA
jgi:hypothetical protein